MIFPLFYYLLFYSKETFSSTDEFLVIFVHSHMEKLGDDVEEVGYILVTVCYDVKCYVKASSLMRY